MPIIFAFPGYELLTDRIVTSYKKDQTDCQLGDCTIHSFPDNESLVTIHTDVANKDIILVCGLDDADSKAMPLLFFTKLARELGAQRITLCTPYLGYMRQDTRFKQGQAITSAIFAKFVSSLVDRLITVDPHLHRYPSLDKIYTIPTTVVHAAPEIGKWIEANVEKPLIIGPDEESIQWVQAVAASAQAPFLVLKKIRHGDADVEISLPYIESYQDNTPVLVDDIISTAQTMIKTVEHLSKAKWIKSTRRMNPPVCIGIHAIFAGDSYANLQRAGVAKIVTTNTILHETNEIDISSLVSKALKG